MSPSVVEAGTCRRVARTIGVWRRPVGCTAKRGREHAETGKCSRRDQHRAGARHGVGQVAAVGRGWRRSKWTKSPASEIVARERGAALLSTCRGSWSSQVRAQAVGSCRAVDGRGCRARRRRPRLIARGSVEREGRRRSHRTRAQVGGGTAREPDATRRSPGKLGHQRRAGRRRSRWPAARCVTLGAGGVEAAGAAARSTARGQRQAARALSRHDWRSAAQSGKAGDDEPSALPPDCR